MGSPADEAVPLEQFRDIATQELFATALAEGVAFIPGPALSASGSSTTPCGFALPPPPRSAPKKASSAWSALWTGPGSSSERGASRGRRGAGLLAESPGGGVGEALTEAEANVLSLFDEADVVELASALIAAAGENPGGTEQETVEVLRRACESHGFDVRITEVVPVRPNLVATLPGGSAPGTGRSAHSGRPADGRNAIDAAAKIVDLIRADHERLQTEQDDLLGAGSWNIGRIDGGTGTSVLAGECRIWIDRRLMPGEDPRTIVTALERQITAAGIATDGIVVRFEVTMEMPGFRTSADHPLVERAVAAIADGGGGTSAVGGWSAACDGGFIARDWGIPTIVLGPGSLNDQAHKADESVSVNELLAAARTYTLICLRTLG